MKIGVIGAGTVGGNLGARLSKSGLEVKFGVQPGKDVNDLLARCGKDARASSVEEAAKWADVVLLAVPGNVAVDVARSIAPVLAGKVLVDCNNALVWKDGPVWAPPAEGSLAAALAKAAPGAKVVKAFNTFGAEHHADPQLTGAPATVFMAGDDADAKKVVADVAKAGGFQPVDAGGLRNAGVLENVAILWIHMATVGGRGRNFLINVREK